MKQNCKKLYVGNLNPNVTEEDINELFGLKSTDYLRQNCSVEMLIDRNTGKSKGFAFLKAPLHVSDELIKLNGFEFQKQTIRIENAQTSRQMRHHNRFSINQQNARPNSCINRDSSNQHIFKSKVIPGEKTFAETMSSSMTSSNPTFNESTLPTSNAVIFGDSLVNFNRKTKCNINRSLNNGSTRFKYFPGATSKDLLYYVDTTLQDNLFEVPVIHINVNSFHINDIFNNKNSLNTDHMLENINNIALTCNRYGIQEVLISGLLTTNRLAQDVTEEVNKLIKNMCNIEGYCYVNYDNIIRANLFKYGLHLLDTGKQILADNFVFNVNINFLMSRTFHPNVHLTAV